MKKQSQAEWKGENPLSVVPKTRPSYEDIPLVNPKKEPLTPAVLRTFKGFDAISYEEAEKICRTSLLLAQVLLEFLATRNTTYIDNQHVVYSSGENEVPVVEINSPTSKPTKNKAA
ncbi:hypothetical protein [Flavisolibacter nicotianae]|uniref:hypothetical protein n=1 Tax=Flavisolibacter nicotianae TaxID=2364882 RepID=UPI000EB15DB5|nr:hypothetical protein [Flavisolibacter nicotianae]